MTRDDLVRITFSSEGRPASFAVDAYRIMKRAARMSITFEFRADQTGTFPFYCNLTSDPGCEDMSRSCSTCGRNSSEQRSAGPQ